MFIFGNFQNLFYLHNSFFQILYKRKDGQWSAIISLIILHCSPPLKHHTLLFSTFSCSTSPFRFFAPGSTAAIPRRNIATGETSPAITPYHTYHFSISTPLTFIISKLPSQNDFHHFITFTTR